MKHYKNTLIIVILILTFTITGCGSKTIVQDEPEKNIEETIPVEPAPVEEESSEVPIQVDNSEEIHKLLMEGYDYLNEWNIEASKSSFEHILELEEGNADAFIGVSNVLFMTNEPSVAINYLRDAKEKYPDSKLEDEIDVIKSFALFVNYTNGRTTDAFAKEKSQRAISLLTSKIDTYATGRDTLKKYWEDNLARLYYVQEDFETYLQILFGMTDLSELEPTDNGEYITYGTRWNEEKEEYETFILNRWWVPAEKPCVIYSENCDIHGKLMSRHYSESEDNTVTEEYTYGDDGKVLVWINDHQSKSSSTYVTTTSTYTWTEYLQSEHPDDTVFDETDDNLFLKHRYAETITHVQGSSPVTTTIEDDEIADEYGNSMYMPGY